MRYADVKKFLDLTRDAAFAIYFKHPINNEDYFEVAADDITLEENALLIKEITEDTEDTEDGKIESYYLFDLDDITQMRSNY